MLRDYSANLLLYVAIGGTASHILGKQHNTIPHSCLNSKTCHYAKVYINNTQENIYKLYLARAVQIQPLLFPYIYPMIVKKIRTLQIGRLMNIRQKSAIRF